MSILAEIKASLVTSLTPLVGTGAEQFLQVSSMPFFAGEDIGLLIEQTRARMPGAFLSAPVAQYNSDMDVTVPDLALTYQLLLGNTTRRSYATRETYAFTMHDLVWNLLFYTRLSNATGTTLDYIRPQAFQYVDIDAEDLSALLFTFTVGVRKWLIIT